MAGPSTSHDDGSDKRQEEIIHIGLGGVSIKFVWENIDSFPTSRETFCNVYGSQFDTAELDVVSVFENIFDIALIQLIVEETNKYAQQEISKSIKPLTFRSRILGRGHSVDGQLLSFTGVGSVLEVQKTDCVGTLRDNRKNVPPLVKNTKLTKGEHCGQYSGDVAVLA
jgi:hypothetical protein